MPFKNITGQRFNRLVAKEYDGKNKHGRALWKCKCDCGKETVVDVTSLLKGHTKSCGCYKRDAVSLTGHNRTTHGMCGTRIYREWATMIQRCRNDVHYTKISVCDEWLDFEPFYEWAMANGYKDSLEIDRINNSGNYEPDNCRWTTRSQQMRNTRANRMMTYGGVTKCQVEWLNILGVCKKSFYNLRKKGFSDNQIIKHFIEKRGIVNEIS